MAKSKQSRFLHKISTEGSAIIVFILLTASVAYALYLFAENIAALESVSNTRLFKEKINIAFYESLGICLGSILIATLYFHHKNTSFLKRINTALNDALSDRKLSEHFPHLSAANTFDASTSNIKSLLTLFRSFDNMKSNRIATDANSLRLILDHSEQGIVILNKEKVVIQTNHPAEQVLRLIPGEIDGQVITRKVSQPDLLHAIDLALAQDQKTTDKLIKLADKKVVSASIYPVNNKLGEVMRAIMILTPKKAPKKVKPAPSTD